MTSPIATGSAAPDFRAPSSHGQTLDRESFLGKVPVVLVFPSPGRTTDLLRSFDDHLVEFGHRRIQALAVVPETPRSVRDRADRDGLSLPILADADGSIAESFGAAPDQAFVIGADGIVAMVLDAGDGPGPVFARLDGFDRGPDGGSPYPVGRTLDQEGVNDLAGPLPSTARTGDPQEGEPPPNDRPRASVDFGTTASEQRHGESLERRLTREEPDRERPLSDLPPTLVGDPLLDDREAEMIATDAGTDPMQGLSPEELAVHVVDET